MVKDYTYPSVLVETAWLAKNLSNPQVKVVEVDWTAQNRRNWIPGAILFKWQEDIWDHLKRDFVTGQNFKNLMERSGIGNNAIIVLYGDSEQFATYAFWFLKYNGHRDARILNGGLKKWEAEGRKLTNAAPMITPTNYKTKRPDGSIRALRDYVSESVGRDDRVLLDVRSSEEYEGKRVSPPGMDDYGAYRLGRIPGAVHVYWEEALRPDRSFKSAEELWALYTSKGVTPDKEIVIYCRLGHRATHTWFVLKYLLGYPNVRVYDGSWTEWGNLVQAPIEKPP